ncbi:pyroglutamyl-peptidase I [Ectobacillus ponti]|uniref:Pyrrolidone-carboxylate peptidase n=1 Tax=Ectobacillus ponti TaxID=2961894 RepID=A0AA41XBU4_9BACI|nr:pyroglutamyl-peptidase I [Ectobacillus ponti]MCP8970474.1 pyroglutamyl-peptidase I [Ectobacillus ponti]
MKTVLVTGFDPFGGDIVNPALEAVKQLEGYASDSFRVEVRELPTVFGRSIEKLRGYMEELQPDLILCVGQAGGRTDMTVERVAINVNDARIPDNASQQPIDTEVVPGGPVAYWSTLPVKALVKEMTEQGIPASVSHTAGTFVCNHIFYGLMHQLAVTGSASRGGFIHIPYLPEQAARQAGQPSMALETIVKGLRISIDAAVRYEKDIVAVGGQIS